MNRIQRALDVMRHPGETPEQTRYRRRKAVLEAAAAEGLQVRQSALPGGAAGPQALPDELRAELARALGVPVAAIRDIVAVPTARQPLPAFGMSMADDDARPEDATVDAETLPELDGRPLAKDEAAVLRAYRTMYETSGLAEPRDFIFACVPLSSAAGALMTDQARFEISHAATKAAHAYLAKYLDDNAPGARA
jgi:hypothetical protein